MEQDNKSKNLLIAQTENGLTLIGEEQVTNSYICEGLTAVELANKFGLDAAMVSQFIEDNQLDTLRAAHIKHGLAKLQSTQLANAEKLMTLENQFKRIRIVQIEKILEDYMAYYSKYGHFYKVHPVTSEILKDTNGIPLQIKLPNVSAEIVQLKESFSLSEGLKVMLGHIDDIINKPKDVKKLDNSVIDVTEHTPSVLERLCTISLYLATDAKQNSKHNMTPKAIF
jgi:predicted transcriptional regulator